LLIVSRLLLFDNPRVMIYTLFHFILAEQKRAKSCPLKVEMASVRAILPWTVRWANY